MVPSARLLPSTLRALVREADVSTVFLTTSLFHLFVEEDLGAFQGLSDVLTGGERLLAGPARRFLTAYPDLPLTNCYGPVESCVFASVHRVTAGDCAAPDGVPLGTAIPGTEIHVLSGNTPVTPGATGEICISGDGLAREYLGAPELSARSFPVVPIGSLPTRIYRTGDLGRTDHRGVLHFRGRSDRQMKIAGHRVDPEEIEEAGRSIPGVRDCVVAATADHLGSGTRLACSTPSTRHPAPAAGTCGRPHSAASWRHCFPPTSCRTWPARCRNSPSPRTGRSTTRPAGVPGRARHHQPREQELVMTTSLPGHAHPEPSTVTYRCRTSRSRSGSPMPSATAPGCTWNRGSTASGATSARLPRSRP
ncbi:AMP-binding protein [Streptomyces sp. B21-102]